MSVGWELSEGGALLDDADITIEKAYFGYDAGYQGGEALLLILEGTTDGTEDGTFRQLYSVGAGWETNDRGKTMEHNDSNKLLTKTSNYGMFIRAAFEVGAEEVLKSRGTPDQADIWKGLEFHVERQEIERKGLKREDGRPFELLLPTDFLGEADDKPKKKKGKKGKKDVGAKALRAKVIVLAKKAEDHDEFVTNVMDKYPEAEDDAELWADVLDEDGIWAEV